MLVSIIAVYSLVDLKARSKASYDLYLKVFDRLDDLFREHSKTKPPSAKQQVLSITYSSSRSGKL